MLQKSKDILQNHNLRSTKFRHEVLEIFLNHTSKALNLSKLEESLGSFDRITLYRTLKRFEQAGIIHKVLVDSEESRYALCHDDCSEHNHTDDHPHFLCNNCGETFCLDELNMPEFKMPANYKLQDVQLALSGICAECNN